MGCWGTCLTMVFTRGCRGVSAPVPGVHAPPSLYCSWDLQSSFSHIFSLTSLAAIPPVQQHSSPSQICFPSSTAAIPYGLGPDQLQVHLGARWHWLHQTLEKLLAASQRNHFCSPLLPKPCHANPMMMITIIIIITIIMKSRERRIKPKRNKQCTLQFITPVQSPAYPQAMIGCSWSTPPHLYTIHDVQWHGTALWPVWITCPGHAPSQIPVELLSCRK